MDIIELEYTLNGKKVKVEIPVEKAPSTKEELDRVVWRFFSKTGELEQLRRQAARDMATGKTYTPSIRDYLLHPAVQASQSFKVPIEPLAFEVALDEEARRARVEAYTRQPWYSVPLGIELLPVPVEEKAAFQQELYTPKAGAGFLEQMGRAVGRFGLEMTTPVSLGLMAASLGVGSAVGAALPALAARAGTVGRIAEFLQSPRAIAASRAGTIAGFSGLAAASTIPRIAEFAREEPYGAVVEAALGVGLPALATYGALRGAREVFRTGELSTKPRISEPPQRERLLETPEPDVLEQVRQQINAGLHDPVDYSPLEVGERTYQVRHYNVDGKPYAEISAIQRPDTGERLVFYDTPDNLNAIKSSVVEIENLFKAPWGNIDADVRKVTFDLLKRGDVVRIERFVENFPKGAIATKDASVLPDTPSIPKTEWLIAKDQIVVDYKTGEPTLVDTLWVHEPSGVAAGRYAEHGEWFVMLDKEHRTPYFVLEEKMSLESFSKRLENIVRNLMAWKGDVNKLHPDLLIGKATVFNPFKLPMVKIVEEDGKSFVRTPAGNITGALKEGLQHDARSWRDTLAQLPLDWNDTQRGDLFNKLKAYFPNLKDEFEELRKALLAGDLERVSKAMKPLIPYFGRSMPEGVPEPSRSPWGGYLLRKVEGRLVLSTPEQRKPPVLSESAPEPPVVMETPEVVLPEAVKPPVALTERMIGLLTRPLQGPYEFYTLATSFLRGAAEATKLAVQSVFSPKRRSAQFSVTEEIARGGLSSTLLETPAWLDKVKRYAADFGDPFNAPEIETAMRRIAANFDVSFNGTRDATSVISAIVEAFGDKIHRIRLTSKEIDDLARQLNLKIRTDDRGNVLGIEGSSLDTIQLRALILTIKGHAEAVARMLQRTNSLDIEEKATLVYLINALRGLVKIVRNEIGDAGRKLQQSARISAILQSLSEGTPEVKSFIQAALEKDFKDSAVLDMLSDAANKMGLYAALEKSVFSEAIFPYVAANLLWSPTSFAIQQILSTAVNLLEVTLSGRLWRGKSIDDVNFFIIMPYVLKATAQMAMNALHEFAGSVHTTMTHPALMLRRMETSAVEEALGQIASRLTGSESIVKGARFLGRLQGYPLQNIANIDTFGKSLVFYYLRWNGRLATDPALRAQVREWVQALKAGRMGADEVIQNIRFVLKDFDPNVDVLALEYAHEALYQGSPVAVRYSPWDAWIRSWKLVRRSLGLLGNLVIPFTTVPLNIVRFSADLYTHPFRLASELAETVVRRPVDQPLSEALADFYNVRYPFRMARHIVGTATWLLGTYLYMDGRITTNPPTDPGQSSMFYAQGKRPFAIKIGDWWVPAVLFGHVGGALLLVAYTLDHLNNRVELSPEEQYSISARAMRVVLGMLQYGTELSVLMNIENLFQLLSNPDRKTVNRLAATLVQPLVPMHAAFRLSALLSDPTIRDPDTFAEYLMVNFPGVRQLVPERLDVLGRKIEPTGSSVSNFINAFFLRHTVERKDPYLNELALIGFTPRDPQNRVDFMGGEFRMEPVMFRRYQTLSRRLFAQMVVPILEQKLISQSLANVDGQERLMLIDAWRSIMRDALHQAREVAKSTVLAEVLTGKEIAQLERKTWLDFNRRSKPSLLPSVRKQPISVLTEEDHQQITEQNEWLRRQLLESMAEQYTK